MLAVNSDKSKTMSDSKASENEIDPTVDIASEHFDPLKALYSENVRIPYKNAKVYDNVSQYESKVLRPKTNTAENEASTSIQSTSSAAIPSNVRTDSMKAKKFSVSDEPVVRRFLPHQRKAFFLFISIGSIELSELLLHLCRNGKGPS